jgi:hypothetical protein
MRALGIFGLIAVILIGGAALVFQFARPAFPLTRVLTDRDGSTYDVVIVGKEAETLVVEPEGTPDPFEIPIQSLKFSDWIFAQWLPDEKPPPVRDLPVHRTITSSDGKSLKVRIVGKQPNVLIVERVSDNVRFEIPLERLSEADKRFFNRLRNEVLPKTTPDEPDYVTKRRILILDLTERAELYKKEIASQTLSSNLHEKRIQDLANVEKEIRELEVAIENFKFRNRSN